MPRKHHRRIVSFVLAICLAVTLFGAGALIDVREQVYAEEDPNVAEAVLTDKFTSRNFTEVRMGEKDNINYLVRGGTRSWFMDNTKKQDSAYMYFNLSDSFAYEVNDGTVFELEFEYYSQNEGWFQLKYDGQRKEERNGDVVYIGNSKSWETVTMRLDDAYFGNRLRDGYDFMLTIYALQNNYGYSGSAVPIRNVRVTKYPKMNPVTNYFNIEESGNIFSDFQEEKIIYNNLKNTTNQEQTVELKSRAVTVNGEVKWEGSQSVTLAPYEEKAVPTNIETDWCELYNYYMEIYGDGFTSAFKPQRFAIVKTDPDGIRNERYFINIHPERWQDTTDQMADVLVKMNAQGTRQTYGWRFIEWNYGDGMGTDPKHELTHKRLSDRGLTLLLCLNQFTNRLPMNPWMLGDSDELKAVQEQYEKAITHIVQNSPEGTLFQVWNEPFVTYMTQANLTDPSPEGFAKFTRDTVDLIHEVRPSAKVGIWCLHGMVREDVYKNFYLPAMESEYNMWETADALTQHPYTRSPIEQTTMVDTTIKKFKDEFDKRGREDIEVWNTEVGYTPIDKDVANEENKAAFDSRTFMVLTAAGVNDIFVRYNLEQKGIVMSNREANFGIVTCGDSSVADIYGKNYTATEAYVAAAAMNYLLPQITPDGEYKKDGVWAYRFKSGKFNKDIVSIWNINGDEVRRVDLGTNSISYFDVNGNETKLTSEDGTYTFDITHQPFYLMGDIPKVEILEEVPEFTLSQKEYDVLPGDKMSVDVIKNMDGDYTIETAIPEYMELFEQTGFENNKATLTFDIVKEFEDSAYIVLNIKDGAGRLVQKLEVRCKMKETAISSDISSSLGSMVNLNRWKVTVTIKNESNTYLKRGYIKFNAPGKFAALSKVDIGPIPPQKTAAIEINCPEIVEKGMYTLDYDIVLDDGKTYNFSKEVDFTVATRMKDTHPIVIDGEIGSKEWNKSAAMYINGIEQVVGFEDWGGKNDISGYYIVSWDEENFYLCANVTDDIYFQNGNAIKSLSQGDSITFGVYDDIEVYVNSGQGNVDYHGFDVALTENGVKVYRNKAQTFNAIATGEVTDQLEVAVKRDGNKTYYELKYPWESLLGYEYTPEVGKEIWFASALNENDGKGRRGFMQFSSGLSAVNVELFAKLRFIDAN